MDEYRRRSKAKTVLALCFAESSDAFHHWRVFASGLDGVCIEFDKESLLSALSADDRIRHGPMNYTQISKLEKSVL